MIKSCFYWLVIFSAICNTALAQNAVYSKAKPRPAQINPNVLVIWEPVVTRQWPVLGDTVNAPTDLAEAEPGQCVRFAVLATGDDRDALLNTSTFSFDLTLDGKKSSFPTGPAISTRKLKPEGGDFVTQTLSVAGIAAPSMSMASLAVSEARWCVPNNVDTSVLTISGTAKISAEKTIPLTPRKLQLQSFAQARKKTPFTDLASMSRWMQHYHSAPSPALLLPALRLVAVDEKATNSWNILQFFAAALQDSPMAARELMERLPQETPAVRALSDVILINAGYEEVLNNVPADRKELLSKFKFPDPFDLTPDRDLPTRMDMMWATLFATGEPKTVRTIASMLAWRSDSDDLDKLQKSGVKPAGLTDSIMRAVSYRAAGWSLNALSRSDGLVADYLESVNSAPDTPSIVKTEIKELPVNPAFQMDSKKKAQK